MSKRKEEVLEKTKIEDLLELAKSVLDESAISEAGRRELVSIVKNSLSIEETEKRLQELKNEKIGTGRKQADQRHLFRGESLLKASIIVLSISFIVIAVSGAAYRYEYNYIQSLVIDYELRNRLIMDLILAYFYATATGSVIRIIGLALLTYWLFSSAIRVSAVNHTTGAVLAIAGSILVAGFLISTMTIGYVYPYYY